MKRSVAATIILCFVFSMSACTTLSRTDQLALQELKACGISSTEVKAKEPVAAAILNVFPGFGNFYLAIGTDEGAQWMYGLLNLLFWPISVAWAVPEAYIDADTINKKETLFYYTVDKLGKKEFEKLCKSAESAAEAVAPAQPQTTAPSAAVPNQ